MLMTNLAEPEWISIHCEETLLADVVCSMGGIGSTENDSILAPNNTNVCSNQHIMIQGHCFLFLSFSDFVDITTQTVDVCVVSNMRPLGADNMGKLNFVLNATSAVISPLLF